MKLEIKGFEDMTHTNQKFSKWKIFEANETATRYELCARDRGADEVGVCAVAIRIYKEPSTEVAPNVYEVKIYYDTFTNKIWTGYVRYSDIKNKSGFFQMMLEEITKYENNK